ncbi:MAG: aminoglycoside N(3)-acetyltransferase [Candidatus Thorarchaeota archaeon]
MEPWMKERDVVNTTERPITKSMIIKDLRAIGIESGDSVIVHSSLSKIGWVVGREITVIDALLETLTLEGTLIMPAFSYIGGNPERWKYPPVPSEWWPVIKTETPVFRPDVFPVTGVGRIPAAFPSYPNVCRSSHPQVSFTAWGKDAKSITCCQRLEDSFGKDSPLEKLYNSEGKVLLLGVGHDANTSLHYAEVIANNSQQPKEKCGATVLVDGESVWKEWIERDYMSEDFPQIGKAFEELIGIQPQKIGLAESRLFQMKEMVDFAASWMKSNRSFE